MNLALCLSEEAAAQLFKVTAGPGKILVLHKLTESNSIPPQQQVTEVCGDYFSAVISGQRRTVPDGKNTISQNH